MFKLGKKNSIVLAFKDEFVDIVVGNKNEIKLYDSIPIEEGICVEGTIKDEARLSELLLKYFLEHDIDEDEVSFVIFGSDVITRHIQLPYMNSENLRETIEFEVKELVQNGEDYYVDYEIVGKEKGTRNPKLDVLVAACIKSKIDGYVELSKSLGKRLKVIDVLTNTINKVLLNSDLEYKNKTIALFYLGYSFSIVSIINDGIMRLERNIPFGFQNIIREYKKGSSDYKSSGEKSSYSNSNKLYIKNFDLLETFEECPKIKDSIDNLLSIVYKTIKFYDSGKNENNVNRLVILHSLELNKVAAEYIEDYFSIKSKLVRNIEELGLQVKNTNKEFGRFLPLYGLFLRRY
ncbi:pilus assembly protein PilM [Clostridium sardiniense]|uniref:pilus assembly protein PilM n=1 Tax=Clostridium sardiniense TaxID=29369 RepID=UPI00195AEC6D|nr:pilus assembly protein PilM [Clostridium sardiniense]MBM7834444.1 type IV pilus assembly protein PilM [Clostridium sardiniense]